MTSQEREFNVMDKEELQELVSDLQKQLQEAQDKLENFLQTAIKEIGARELADYITGQ